MNKLYLSRVNIVSIYQKELLYSTKRGLTNTTFFKDLKAYFTIIKYTIIKTYEAIQTHQSNINIRGFNNPHKYVKINGNRS